MAEILEKKIDSYRFEENNFVAESELMVTITLGEYRDLIAMNARMLCENDRLKKLLKEEI